MCDMMNADVRRQGSILPDMLVQACALCDARFSGLRSSYADRIEGVYRVLASDYMARKGLAKLTGRTPNRLRALAKWIIDLRISAIHPLPRLYVASEDTDLRVSLPHCYIVSLRGKVVLLALYYNEKLPLFDGHGLTVVGQCMMGGLSIAFDSQRVVDEVGIPFDLPIAIDDIAILDVARQRKDRDALLHQASAVRGLFLSAYKEDFVTLLGELARLYSVACRHLGVDDTERTPDSSGSDGEEESSDGTMDKKLA